MHRVIKNLYFINSISMRAVTLRTEEDESECDKSVRSNCTIMSSLHS